MVGTRKGVSAVRVIVVGKNPGHPISEEAERYCKAISSARTDEDKAALLFDAMVRWGEHDHLKHPETTTTSCGPSSNLAI